MSKLYGTPGPRALHPSAARSGSLAACSVQAQLLFDRLIAASDDQGRQIGEAQVVWASCMPLLTRASPRLVERWISELEAHRMVVRYETGGVRLLQVVNWWRYQAGQRHIFPSRWPPPDGVSDRLRGRGEEAAKELQTGMTTFHNPDGDDVSRDADGTPTGPYANAIAPAISNAAASAAPALPDRESDRYQKSAAETYQSLYGRISDAKRAYLEDLEGKYGRDRTIKALIGERNVDPDPMTIGGRVKSRLRN